jgi:hypothetical protein
MSIQTLKYKEGEKQSTVVIMVLIVIKHKYAPIAATAGLSFLHHQTQVVPNQTPVIPKVKPKLAMNAQGESPPVKKRPPKKNLFREGWVSWFFTMRPLGVRVGMADSGGFWGGGVDMNEWSSGEGECGSWEAEMLRSVVKGGGGEEDRL